MVVTRDEMKKNPIKPMSKWYKQIEFSAMLVQYKSTAARRKT
jgi:hypothetical protein